MMQKNRDSTNGSKNVKVYVRILPLLRRCKNCAKISHDKKTIYVRCLQDMKQEKNQSKEPLYWSFMMDRVFYYSSQEEIYRETMSGIINNVLDGASFVLISCGQTGTGKSFTTGGLRNNWEHRGLVPRLISDLTIEKEHRKRTNRIHYSLSFVEFREKKFKDLLNPNFDDFYNTNSHDALERIRKMPIKNEKIALQYIFQGEGRRSIAELSEYPVCHLGTSVITFHVRNTSLITSWSDVATTTIHIVEMAGIDNTRNFRCPKTAREIITANSMKLEIEQYFERFGKIDIIPRPHARSSFLLKYLGDAISSNSIVRFIAHVRITQEDLDVSLSTLRFVGKMAKSTVTKVPFDVRSQSTSVVKNLKDEIERLKKELFINEIFYRQEALMNVSAKRAQQIQNDFHDFLNGTIPDIELISLSQAKVLTRIMKDFYAKTNAEKELALTDVEKSENTFKNASRISKSSIQGSTKGNNRIGSHPKDVHSEINGEVSEKSSNDKVGTLDDNGITLGPGISEVPAESIANVSNSMTKSKYLDHQNNGDLMNKESKEKYSEDNMRKTFLRLQGMLKRVVQVNYTAGSLDKKHLKESPAVSRASQRNNKK